MVPYIRLASSLRPQDLVHDNSDLIVRTQGKEKNFVLLLQRKKMNTRDDHKVVGNVNSYVYNLHNLEMFLVLFEK